MKLLIRQATILSPHSPLHRQTKDLLIQDGTILSIDDQIENHDVRVIEAPDLHISTGWMDIFADFADPGFEYRETLQTGASAAAAGGFTDVMLLPNTKPAIHDKSQVNYITSQSKQLPVNLLPIGAITKNTEGKELAEMYDMQEGGAVAFSDGIKPLQQAGIMIKALQYVKAFNGTIIQVPEDTSIGAGGLMNEGIISTRLGLPGKPAIAEELMVARDINLAQYTESRIHFTGISTAQSIEHIRKAKEAGIQVTASASPCHLFFTEEDLQHYDTNLKLNPPLRSKSDRDALRAALLDGTIDCIASHHLPQHSDHKDCEFEYAKPGMITLEALFASVNTWWTKGIDELVNTLAVKPRQVFGIPVPEIKAGTEAKLTLFSPSAHQTFSTNQLRSKSANCAFTGHELKGLVYGIINGNKNSFS